MSPLPGELRRQYASCDYDVRHNVSAFGLYQVPFHSNHALLRQIFGGWSFSETAFLHSGLPFSVLSQPLHRQRQWRLSGKWSQHCPVQRACLRHRPAGVPVYSKNAVTGVSAAEIKQWLNPDAFVSVVDPATGACTGGDSPINCRFGNSGRTSVRGPHYTGSDIYISKTFPIREGVTFRSDAQMFNAFNHPNFALPSEVEAGVPGGSIPARFGTLESTIAPPTGLLGVGLGGDSSPRMIAFQGRIEF